MKWVSYSNIHYTLAFLPWHREFINRYEILLQQYDPTVKLLYWDWTTDPTTTLSFMGSFSGSIGAPFNPTSGPTLAPPSVTRTTSGPLPAEADSTVLARMSRITRTRLVHPSLCSSCYRSFHGGPGRLLPRPVA